MGNLIRSTEYGTRKTILIANDSYLVTLPARVTNTGVAAVDGKKVLKAGTPLSGDITKRGTAFVKGTAENSVAVLLHDVDVTDGAENATIILAGVVDLLKLESDVQILAKSAQANLPRIIFVEGSEV